MSVYPAAPKPIDWEYYKAKISKPGFVDSFKKQVSFCVVLQLNMCALYKSLLYCYLILCCVTVFFVKKSTKITVILHKVVNLLLG